MGFLSVFKGLIGKVRQGRYARMLNGQIPVFSSVGKDIYAYDIMRNAIAVNCIEMSKLTPQHIRLNVKKNTQEIVNDSIQKLLTVAPNPYMTPSDFLSRCRYMYETTDNCYIYPTFEKRYTEPGKYYREYTGFYPLDPASVEFLDCGGEIYLHMTFGGGDEISVPYADIIHWKKNVSAYDIVGGDAYEDNRAFINLLNADNTAIQNIDKAVKARFNISGVLKINVLESKETQQATIRDFEEKLASNKSGILVTDLKSDYTPLSIDPQIVDKDTMEFIEQRILARVGVPLAIYNRCFTEEEYHSYYELTLENSIKSFSEAFTKTLFTQGELDHGNRIIAYQQGLIYSSIANKVKVVEILSPVGALSVNEVRAMFGLPPVEGGDTRYVSLNYVNSNYATDYQMGKLKGLINDGIPITGADKSKEGNSNGEK